MSETANHLALPPIGRRPVLAIEQTSAPDTTNGPPTTTALERPATGTAPFRLLVGSHLLLLIQTLLILTSGIDLGAARPGIAAISTVSSITLAWAALGRFAGRSRSFGGRHYEA